MLITVKRKNFNDTATIGEMLIDDKFLCHTLEDKVRDNGEKIFGKTAIPYGKYEVVTTMSNRFKKLLPLLLDVPNFTGVRIHAGNTSANTEGCILVGTWDGKSSDFIGSSRVAFDKFMPVLVKALKAGKVYIEIVKG
jgi:hypothetical protein